MMANCIKCGKQNSSIAKFCIGCGTVLGNPPETEKTLTLGENKTPGNKTKLIAIVIVILFALGTGSYFIFFNKRKQPTTAAEKNESRTDTTQTDYQPVVDTIQTKLESVKTKMNDGWTTEHSLVSDAYSGTIGNKRFILKLEAVSGNKVKGYNITGNNRRPVEGAFTESHGNFDQFGDGTVMIFTNIYELILKEPGTDKWDGEFNLKIELCDWFNEGKGTWHSYNGKLNHTIEFSDKELEKLLSDK